MRRLFDVSRWPALVVFLFAGVLAAGFAFCTVSLFSLAMANLSFLQRHGLVAVMEGALVQLAGLVFWGLVALAAFVGFKICEGELVTRYRRWCEKE